MQNIAVIDIDDTLADMRSVLQNELQLHTGKNIHWEQWTDHSAEHLYGIDKHQFFDILRDSKILERMTPHAESINFIQSIKRTHKVAFLTARAWHSRGLKVTKQWLKQHSFVYDELILCNVTDSKSKIINEHFGNVDFTVDDSIKHCSEYSINPNINHVFVYDMPWNKTLTAKNINRINNLNQIVDKIYGG